MQKYAFSMRKTKKKRFLSYFLMQRLGFMEKYSYL